MAARTRVLFVCVGNTCRSQIAEALARHTAADVIEPSSAGISPFGRIVEPTRAILRERGVSLDGQYSKGLREVDPDSFALIVNMTGMPGRSLFPGGNVVDWEIDDPYGEDLGVYRRILEDIEELLNALASDLRRKACSADL
ncbi:MAG TPA: low molecular weight phosphatase family protein [Candidatus Acidoferrales bacterium]